MVNEVLLGFLRWAEGCSRTPDGKPTHEIVELKLSLRPVRELYGHVPAREFGPKAMVAVRQQMIDALLSRTPINRRDSRLRAGASRFPPPAVADLNVTITEPRA